MAKTLANTTAVQYTFADGHTVKKVYRDQSRTETVKHVQDRVNNDPDFTMGVVYNLKGKVIGVFKKQ